MERKNQINNADQQELLNFAITSRDMKTISSVLPNIERTIMLEELHKLIFSDLDFLDEILRENMDIIINTIESNDKEKIIQKIFNDLKKIKELNPNEKNTEFQKIFTNIIVLRKILRKGYGSDDNVISRLILVYLKNSTEIFNDIDINANLLKNAIEEKDVYMADFLISNGANLKNIRINDYIINGLNFRYEQKGKSFSCTLPVQSLLCDCYNLLIALLNTQNININVNNEDKLYKVYKDRNNKSHIKIIEFDERLFELIAAKIVKIATKNKIAANNLRDYIIKTKPGLLESFEIVLNKGPEISNKMNITSLYHLYYSFYALQPEDIFKDFLLRNKNNIQTILRNNQKIINNSCDMKSICNYIDNIFKNQNIENFTEVEQGEAIPRMQNQQANLSQENQRSHQNQEKDCDNTQTQNQSTKFRQLIKDQKRKENNSTNSKELTK